jgi:hypothetical protein
MSSKSNCPTSVPDQKSQHASNTTLTLVKSIKKRLRQALQLVEKNNMPWIQLGILPIFVQSCIGERSLHRVSMFEETWKVDGQTNHQDVRQDRKLMPK